METPTLGGGDARSTSGPLVGAALRAPLVDRRGRVARKVRISLTDRCNFACLFCMPSKGKVHWLPRQELLSFDEVERLTRVLVSMGVRKVRLTGGEPLLRPKVEELVGRLTRIPGLEEVDMTTNAWFLAEKASALRAAGLHGVTVSLHSLRRDRFHQIAGMDALPRVLEGIEAARREGLTPLKVNSVAIRGYNEDEVLDLVEFARERDIALRFIEFMPLDGRGTWDPEKVVSGHDLRARIGSRYELLPRGRGDGETAQRWGFEDGKGEVGLITPITEPFCDDCDRIRLTADGQFLTCLFDRALHDLRAPLRAGATDEELAETVRACYDRKPPGVQYLGDLRKTWVKPRAMHAIGG
ncbi:MAG: GTP 3',8-cyclase MoaA [Euryarchaeota archaeon]|nr:GTP 3',8-cyclase MoaA [Euryarchaeota archaeon]MDE1836415.1 GTP 3',8-cyclase MoaA [Euryarchaeota archaeon]MDE1879070.1 GTP 3',8-cyclase MoaA [Euryarchaeota archaeon]MDE2044163.1 GTP 3',8-cyclase MoaA [Thermoplasmata archaeon]